MRINNYYYDVFRKKNQGETPPPHPLSESFEALDSIMTPHFCQFLPIFANVNVA